MTFNKSQWSKKYYRRNRERLLAKSKRWNKKHKLKMKIIRKRWRAKNQKKNRMLANDWAKNNREYVLHNASLQSSRRKGANGEHTRDEWEGLKKRCKYTCQRCGRKEPEVRLTKDHIIPLSKGGTNYISNIQPLCRSCNCSKREFID